MTVFQHCPTCESKDLDYVHYDGSDPSFSYWVCENCGESWDDDIAQDNEEIAIDKGFIQHIERLAMYGRRPNDKN